MRVHECVTFANSRGEKLAGILHIPEGGASQAGAVLCHGMESSKSSPKLMAMSEFLCDHGLTVLRFDFAGSGESEGDFADISYSRQVDDLSAAVSYLMSREVNTVGLIGSSMGGSVVLLYAAKGSPVAGVATIAAPTNPLAIVQRASTPRELLVWEEKGFIEYHGRRINRALLDDIRELDIVGAAARITCPVLVIHGDADRTVPVGQAHRLYEALDTDKELLLLPGADHRLSEPQDMITAVSASQNWIVRQVKHT